MKGSRTRRTLLSAVAIAIATFGSVVAVYATQPVPPQAIVIAVPGVPDSAIEFTRTVMRTAGDTPVDLTWQPAIALLSTKYVRNPRGPGTAIVMIAAEVARRQVKEDTWVRVRGWLMDSASTGRRDINGPIQNVSPSLNRTIPITPADSVEWARIEQVVKGLEQLGGRVLRRP